MSVAVSSAALGETSSFTFCRIGLGLRVGATVEAVWNADKSFSRSQVMFILTAFPGSRPMLALKGGTISADSFWMFFFYLFFSISRSSNPHPGDVDKRCAGHVKDISSLSLCDLDAPILRWKA
jgi:hypothetical protein